MNLTAIVSDINGCNEIITHEVNGIIIPPKNTKSIYFWMKELLTNNVLFNNLQNNSRNTIISKYRQDFVWKELLNEYNKQIKQQCY
jgi:glycosyltransferase involved in cell wall biosynthesis